jgi:deoxyribose-phosphate aldolase
MSIAQYIDHTVLKPTTTKEEVNQVCDEAIAFGFAAVCIPPVYVQQAQKKLAGSPVKVATVIGFPFGYEHISAKVTEAEQAVKDGANELDMVMNMTAFKNGDLDTLEKEVKALLSVTEPNGIILKVIIESGILSEEEIIACCELYRKFNVDFLKTSTGYASKGATLEAVQIMRKHLPDHIQIKASGGIKTYAFAQQLIDAGATRLGCSASVAIVQQQPAGEQDY